MNKEPIGESRKLACQQESFIEEVLFSATDECVAQGRDRSEEAESALDMVLWERLIMFGD